MPEFIVCVKQPDGSIKVIGQGTFEEAVQVLVSYVRIRDDRVSTMGAFMYELY